MEDTSNFAGRMRAFAKEVQRVQRGARTSSDPSRREAALALRSVVESAAKSGLWAEHRVDCSSGRKRITNRLITRIAIILRSHKLKVTVRGAPSDAYIYFRMEW